MDSKNTLFNKQNIFFLSCLGILLLIALISIVGPFASTTGDTLSNVITGLFLPFLFVAGYFVRKKVGLSSILFLLCAILGMVSLISLIATLSEYGFFYSAIYKDTPMYFYNGETYLITNEAMLLTFGGITAVSINYFSIVCLFAASFLPAAFFIDRKKKLALFIGSLVSGSIGLLALILIGNFDAVIIFALVSGLAILGSKFSSNKKLTSTINIVLIVCFAVALVFYGLAFINVISGYKAPGIFNRIFTNNKVMEKVNIVISGALFKDQGKYINFWGLDFSYPVGSRINNIACTDTGVFEVELLKEVGIVGVLLVFIFVSLSYFGVNKATKEQKIGVYEQIVCSTLCGGFFVFESLFYSCLPIVRNDTYYPFLRFIPLYIVLFMLGMILSNTKGEVKNEK